MQEMLKQLGKSMKDECSSENTLQLLRFIHRLGDVEWTCDEQNLIQKKLLLYQLEDWKKCNNANVSEMIKRCDAVKDLCGGHDHLKGNPLLVASRGISILSLQII